MHFSNRCLFNAEGLWRKARKNHWPAPKKAGTNALQVSPLQHIGTLRLHARDVFDVNVISKTYNTDDAWRLHTTYSTVVFLCGVINDQPFCRNESRVRQWLAVSRQCRSQARPSWKVGEARFETAVRSCEFFPTNPEGVCEFIPQTGLFVGFYLTKKTLDTPLVGALGLVGRGFGLAGRAGLGWAWGLAVHGVGRAGRVAALGVVSLGRALGTLAGSLRWVRRRVWPAGCAGLGWAWGLAMLGALAGLGVVLKSRSTLSK